MQTSVGRLRHHLNAVVQRMGVGHIIHANASAYHLVTRRTLFGDAMRTAHIFSAVARLREKSLCRSVLS